MPRLSRRMLLAALPALAPALLLAYGVRVHDAMPHEMLGLRETGYPLRVESLAVGPVRDGDLDRFRLALYAGAARLPDTALRRAFLRRYPGVAAFGPRAFKEFLMMDGGAAVLGVDSFAAVIRELGADRHLDPLPPYVSGSPLGLETALRMGSDFVDLDRRNQNRLLRDGAGRLLRTAAGDTVPFDPMTLNMGNLTGTSSQAHAHYGLNHHPKSGDAAVLKSRPWDFAIPIGFGDSVQTFAEANAQAYTDLAYLALLQGGSDARGLSAIYAGNAFHYVEDVGNPIHTLQAGVYGFFVDATLYRAWRRTITLFGLLGPTPSRNSIGVAIVTSHHLMSETLFERELLTALRLDRSSPDSVSLSMRDAVAAMRIGDPRFRGVLARAVDSARTASGACGCPPVGQVVTAAVVEDGDEDGALIYRLTRELGTWRMRRPPAIDFDTLPPDAVWSFVSHPASEKTKQKLADFNEAQARGLARVHEALNAWWTEYLRVAATPAVRRQAAVNAVLARLVSARLAYLDAAEARRAAFIAQHGGPAGDR